MHAWLAGRKGPGNLASHANPPILALDPEQSGARIVSRVSTTFQDYYTTLGVARGAMCRGAWTPPSVAKICAALPVGAAIALQILKDLAAAAPARRKSAALC